MDSFRETLDKLQELRASKDPIPEHEVPEELRPDLLAFMYGKTITFDKQNRPCVYPWDFSAWFRKIAKKGIDNTLNVA